MKLRNLEIPNEVSEDPVIFEIQTLAALHPQLKIGCVKNLKDNEKHALLERIRFMLGIKPLPKVIRC